MRSAGIEGVYRRRRRGCTRRDPTAELAQDLVNRRFDVDGPNELWVSDVERHEALLDRAEVTGLRPRAIAAAREKLGAA
jgi:putative transposase